MCMTFIPEIMRAITNMVTTVTMVQFMTSIIIAITTAVTTTFQVKASISLAGGVMNVIQYPFW